MSKQTNYSGSERVVMPIESLHSSHSQCSKILHDNNDNPIANEFLLETEVQKLNLQTPKKEIEKEEKTETQVTSQVSSPKPTNQVPRVVCGKRFILNCSLAQGSFGKILLCLDTRHNKMRVMKVEPIGPKQLLEFEALVYRELRSVGKFYITQLKINIFFI